MARIDFVLSKEWKELEKLLSTARVTPELTNNLKRATIANGAIAKAMIRQTIKASDFEKNAALTTLLKKSGKPLAGITGELFKAIAKATVETLAVEVGVRKASPIADLAVAVHEGKTIEVTPKMRVLFSVLAGASDPGRTKQPELTGRARELFALFQNWRPLKPSTVAIVLPPRRFITQTVENPVLHRKIARNWLDGASAAIAGVPWSPKTR